MKRALPLIVLLALRVAASAESSSNATPPLGTAPPPPATAAVPQLEESDPFESVNRRIFWFNDQVDTYVLVPAAKGWDFVVPRRAQRSVSNFFANLRFPVDTVNNVLQGKLQYAATDVGRFGINTTVGLAGFFDPASSFGLDPHVEDFGRTLGWWGLGPGPYLVLPILGPSTVRDGAGILVDYPISITPFFVDWYYLFAARTVEVVNFRASVLDVVERAKEVSFDYYTFVRNAYLQRRGTIRGDQAPLSRENQEDLYHPGE
jgi:phospholipid-binding lipoprotein MlaA